MPEFSRPPLWGMVAVYGVVSLVALLWGAIAGHPNILIHPDAMGLGSSDLTVQAILGIAAGLSISAGLLLLLQNNERFAHMDEFLTALVGGFSLRDISALIVVGSIAEELLFRGAMLPTVGVVPQAIIFGMMHSGPKRMFIFLLPWTIMAAILGLFLGWLFVVTGTLVAPICAHLAINITSIVRMRLKIARGGTATLDEVMEKYGLRE